MTSPTGPRTTVTATELDGHADSTFAKQVADLVILGRPDSSRIPVAARRDDIAQQHRQVDYRLVPADTLRGAAATIRAQAREHAETTRMLGEFMAAVPIEQWPPPLRRAQQLLAEAVAAPPWQARP
jgi:hypothetical protein